MAAKSWPKRQVVQADSQAESRARYDARRDETVRDSALPPPEQEGKMMNRRLI